MFVFGKENKHSVGAPCGFCCDTDRK
ncbi:hypothetical protein ELI_4318 [Eubacterium callanderi]|uniref:Uncharacterized protein n=1 Tax=Eubacterium callanderi TaxID=53442 RepID=E3GQG6_9FIRM|nr:hypothetical protein ELI_4318 [Eubacterium callanderi]